MSKKRTRRSYHPIGQATQVVMSEAAFAALADPLLIAATEENIIGGACLETLAEEHGGKWAKMQSEVGDCLNRAFQQRDLRLLKAALKVHRTACEMAEQAARGPEGES